MFLSRLREWSSWEIWDSADISAHKQITLSHYVSAGEPMAWHRLGWDWDVVAWHYMGWHGVGLGSVDCVGWVVAE